MTIIQIIRQWQRHDYVRLHIGEVDPEVMSAIQSALTAIMAQIERRCAQDLADASGKEFFHGVFRVTPTNPNPEIDF